MGVIRFLPVFDQFVHTTLTRTTVRVAGSIDRVRGGGGRGGVRGMAVRILNGKGLEVVDLPWTIAVERGRRGE